MPEISVIVPVYKVETYLRRCIDSILAQTFTDFELILVDDGSPDGCPAICDKYAEKDARVRVIHKENGGVSSARNAGLDIAVGEWIAFVDSDDYVLEDYLKDLYHPDYDFVVAGYSILSQGGGLEEKVWNECCCPDINRASLEVVLNANGTDWLYFCWGRLFKRSLIVDNNVAFDRNRNFGEDSIFSTQYFCICRSILVTEDANYIYSQRTDGTLSTTYTPQFLDDCAKSEDTIAEALSERFGDCFRQRSKEKLSAQFAIYLGDIINNKSICFFRKYVMVKHLYSMPAFQDSLNDVDVYYASTSPNYKRLICTRCPLLILCLFYIRHFLLDIRKGV